MNSLCGSLQIQAGRAGGRWRGNLPPSPVIRSIYPGCPSLSSSLPVAAMFCTLVEELEEQLTPILCVGPTEGGELACTYPFPLISEAALPVSSHC